MRLSKRARMMYYPSKSVDDDEATQISQTIFPAYYLIRGRYKDLSESQLSDTPRNSLT